ncbi:MAG TPA: hypothetical protein VLH09_07980 [Bryobacteraceae bacterium]|nr:hypothetical protein [Bryobacteraceae bacterium]
MHFHRLVLGLAAAAVLLAQPTPRPGAQAGPGVAAVKEFLGLSDQQVQQLIELRREEQQLLQPIGEQTREKAQALRTAMQSASPDPAVVGKLTLDLQNLRKQAAAINDLYHAKALGLLDNAQKEKLETLEQAVLRANRARPAINGATALNLLAPPQPPAGAAPGRTR